MVLQKQSVALAEAVAEVAAVAEGGRAQMTAELATEAGRLIRTAGIGLDIGAGTTVGTAAVMPISSRHRRTAAVAVVPGHRGHGLRREAHAGRGLATTEVGGLVAGIAIAPGTGGRLAAAAGARRGIRRARSLPARSLEGAIAVDGIGLAIVLVITGEGRHGNESQHQSCGGDQTIERTIERLHGVLLYSGMRGLIDIPPISINGKPLTGN